MIFQKLPIEEIDSSSTQSKRVLVCDDVIFRSSFIRDADKVLFSFLESVRPEMYKLLSINKNSRKSIVT